MEKCYEKHVVISGEYYNQRETIKITRFNAVQQCACIYKSKELLFLLCRNTVT